MQRERFGKYWMRPVKSNNYEKKAYGDAVARNGLVTSDFGPLWVSGKILRKTKNETIREKSHIGWGSGETGRHARSRPDNYTTLAAICQEFFAEKNHQISLVIFVQLYECFVKIDEFWAFFKTPNIQFHE